MKERDLTQAMVALGTDAVALIVAAFTLLLASRGAAGVSGTAIAAYPAVVLVLLASTRRYRPRWPRAAPDDARVSLATAAVGALLVSAASLLVGADPVTTSEMIGLWAISSAALCLGIVIVGGLVTRAQRRGTMSAATLVVGAGRVGHLVARRLLARPQLGLRPIGFLDDDPLSDAHRPADLPVLGVQADLEQVIRDHGVARVVIAFSTASDQLLLSVARRCGALRVPVSIVPRLYEVDGNRRSAMRLGGLPLVELSFEDPDRLSLPAKYAVDRIAALIAYAMMLPLLAIVAAAVKLTSDGPILLRQRRVGRHGEAFEILKFRTMTGQPERDGEADGAWLSSVLDAEEREATVETLDRTTAVGRFLRRTSLDELPQLWNVVRGEMCLVGPRPERVSYVDRLSPVVYRYPERHRVKPGITGWAQVNGLRGRTSLEDRVEWDNFYVENWSWALDFTILARTAGAVWRGPQDELGVRRRTERTERRHPLRAAQRLLGLLVLVGVVLTIAPSALGAAGSSAPSAADQYVEDIPSTTGDRPASPNGRKASDGDGRQDGSGGTGGAGGTGGPGASESALSLPAQRALSELDGPTARELERIATSESLGAPSRGLVQRSAAKDTSFVGALFSAVGGDVGTAGILIWLLIALLATTDVVLVTAAYERRQHRRASA